MSQKATEKTEKTAEEFSSPEQYAEYLGYSLNDKVTAKEISDVFNYLPISQDIVIIERDAPPATMSGLVVPDTVRRDRQTGSSRGRILWLGKGAKEILKEKIGASGFDYDPSVGDSISFPIVFPQPLGLCFNGHHIFPGDSYNRYTGIEMIHAEDVVGLNPSKKIAWADEE